MGKVIFLTGSYTRKPKFQTQTRAIKEKGGNIVFQKIAMNDEALPHLLNIKKTSETLASNGLGDLFCKATVKEKSIEFKQVKGESVENLLFEAVLCDDKDAVLDLLNKYEAFLKKMVPGSEHKHSHSYDQSVFGPDFYTKFSRSDCISPGVLDLNFDNLIETGHKFKAIDYEWAFGHCLPYDYILARTIMWFGVRYSDLLKMHSERLDIVALSDEVMLPSLIFDKYPGIVPLIKKVYLIEWDYLQRWVNNRFTKDKADFYKKPVKYTDRSRFAIDNLELQAQMIAELNADKARMAGELSAKDAEIERLNIILSRYPHRIIHKTYKAGGKARRAIKQRSQKQRL